jgi:hypothetical protein
VSNERLINRNLLLVWEKTYLLVKTVAPASSAAAAASAATSAAVTAAATALAVVFGAA